MKATGTEAKELWQTETGWNTAQVSEEAQAAYYEQMQEGVDGYEWLDRVFFYQLVDEPDSTDQWGILRVDLPPKLAYEARLRYSTLHASPAALHRRAVSCMMQQ